MMDPTTLTKTEFWRRHYEQQHRQVAEQGLARSVEYANEGVQMQVYAHLLEGLGSAYGKSILDVGCGWGNSTLMLHACGGLVTGVDIVETTISTLRYRYPFIDWQLVDLMDGAAMSRLPLFDAVVATEVLEHVDVEPAMEVLWSHVAPGGRLVATVPNSECPILQRGRARWGLGELLTHMSPQQIVQAAASLPDVAMVRMKGLTFRDDQEFLPYADADWHEAIDGTPNRIIFVLLRASKQQHEVRT